MYRLMHRLNLGKFKYIFERQMRFIGLWNFMILGSLYVDKHGFSWWYFLLLPAFALSVWLDTKFILPSEASYIHSKSTVLQTILKNSRQQSN